MHQNLFELSLSPIPEDERVTEASFETGDIPNADWWCDEDNREEAVRNLTSMLDTYCPNLVECDLENGTITFLPGFDREWEHQKFMTAQSIARHITLMNEEEFIGGGGSAITRLKWAYDDDFGTYIYSHEDMYSMTIDQFIRETDLDNTTWYIGGIIDWHY